MSRYAKPNVTVDDLKKEIDDAGGIYNILYHEPSQKIIDDISKIEFDCENVTDPDEGENFDMPGFESGYETLPNGVAVCWVGAGGDWEDPIALCVYVGDGGELRAYIPKDGNAYNFKTKAAFGNWIAEEELEEAEYETNCDDEDFSEYEEGCECDHHFDEMKHFGIKYQFDMEKLRSAASNRIIFKDRQSV
jgi:hypothetical protein